MVRGGRSVFPDQSAIQPAIDEICQAHDQIQPGGLQKHLSAKPRQVDDAGDKQISHRGEVFGDPYTGSKGSLPHGDVTHVFCDA